ncbi:type VII secretion target [Streptomyces sp. PT12]|uniref:type VII secretion target n=1 Tax=Streptomyces sp. PT12 TaxID=1510197 RepID=UPI000DE382CD|nr:type VII secretion target [Streptomyces sp. PT12]RBM16888.1 hypothetical protein DEH69_16305 [Streptomyces sp. PT12]
MSGEEPWGAEETPDLSVRPDTLRTVSGAGDALVGHLDGAVTGLRAETVFAVNGAMTLLSLTALERVRTSWEERLTGVREACARLRDGLDAAADDFEGVEADTERDLHQTRRGLSDLTGQGEPR